MTAPGARPHAKASSRVHRGDPQAMLPVALPPRRPPPFVESYCMAQPSLVCIRGNVDSPRTPKHRIPDSGRTLYSVSILHRVRDPQATGCATRWTGATWCVRPRALTRPGHPTGAPGPLHHWCSRHELTGSLRRAPRSFSHRDPGRQAAVACRPAATGQPDTPRDTAHDTTGLLQATTGVEPWAPIPSTACSSGSWDIV